MWHHEHHFQATEDGKVKMTDIVKFQTSFWRFSRFIGRFYVKNKLKFFLKVVLKFYKKSLNHENFSYRTHRLYRKRLLNLG